MRGGQPQNALLYRRKSDYENLLFCKGLSQKSLQSKIDSLVLTNVNYRLRYSFPSIFRSQKSQLQTQNSQLKIPKVPPLEKNRVVFLQNLPSLKTPKNTAFAPFNVR